MEFSDGHGESGQVRGSGKREVNARGSDKMGHPNECCRGDASSKFAFSGLAFQAIGEISPLFLNGAVDTEARPPRCRD